MKKSKRIKKVPLPRRRDDNPNWRRIALVFGSALIIAIALGVFLFVNLLPAKLTANDREALKDYDAIRLALSQDDLKSAQEAAAKLPSSGLTKAETSADAQSIAGAPSLELARQGFKALSGEALRLIRGHREYLIVGCSMSQCPAPCINCQMFRFGNWVQTKLPIANPFMGKASPHCGVIKN